MRKSKSKFAREDNAVAVELFARGASSIEVLEAIYEREKGRHPSRDASDYVLAILEKACLRTDRPTDKVEWERWIKSYRIINSYNFDPTYSDRVTHSAGLARERLREIAIHDTKFLLAELAAGRAFHDVLLAVYNEESARQISRDPILYTAMLFDHTARYDKRWRENPVLASFEIKRVRIQEILMDSPTTARELAASLHHLTPLLHPTKLTRLSTVLAGYTENLQRKLCSTLDLQENPMSLQAVILTLQNCLEKFEQKCQCGQCEPCMRGQDEIRRSIRSMQELTERRLNAATSVRFVLKRKGVRAEFSDRSSLIHFLRNLMRPTQGAEDSTNTDIATMAALNGWMLEEYQPDENVPVTVLLQLALNIIHSLVLATELNMDDLEASTVQALKKTAEFETLAARLGFCHKAQV